MRFIKKKQTPDCLEQLARQHKNNPYQPAKSCWKKLKSVCKVLIRQQMLGEQDYLCAYCERKIEQETDAHIEHIKPKSFYLENCFDYKNLIVSCNGNQCSNVNPEAYEDNIHSCGHPKENYYDKAKFLNPVELTDISDYFSYRIDEGCIEASEKEAIKADYMINLLKLDNPYLNNGRINARKALLKVVQNASQDKNDALKMFKQLLNFNPPPAFISYLRYYFHHSLNTNDSKS